MKVTVVAATLAALVTPVACGADRNDTAAVDVTYATASTTVSSDSTAVPDLAPSDPSGSLTTEVVVTGLDRPVDIAWRPGDGAAYVVEQAGRIVRSEDDRSVVVLDITDRVNDDANEQGLLGLAFHPDLPLAYVNYIVDRDATRISEFELDDDGGFVRSSERSVLEVEQPFANHNGGSLAFGPDGFLYVALGDGGSADDPQRTALDPGSLLGKILRIDPTASDTMGYTIPADNPFVAVAGVRPEIWASGLRNPWRFSWDVVTGDLWIGDVGQGTWEEIDVAPSVDGLDAGRGLNFGWSAYEGDVRFHDDQSADGVTMPVHVYPHDGRCSVTGGVRYRGDAIPALRGWYLFSDYCDGVLRALHPDVASSLEMPVELGGSGAPVAIDAGPDREVYVVDITAGTVSRLIPA